MFKQAVAPAGIVIFIHLLATHYSWYYVFPGFDVPMHLMGGAAVAFAFCALAKRYNIFLENRLLFFLFALGTTALIGILWEFYEFFMDVYVHHTYPLLAAPGEIHFDTLKDLFNDLLGAAVVVLICIRRRNFSASS